MHSLPRGFTAIPGLSLAVKRRFCTADVPYVHENLACTGLAGRAAAATCPTGTLQQVADIIESNALKPRLDAAFPLEQPAQRPEAFREKIPIRTH
ncbi:hypothetical protein AB838_20380 [Rhodobacteraceae bacterium (ex Bugula neritina AB1)]|nr:hypothetical protein AB838_20380 [Rhodobacteraceae bacterium (ex Bugula neritina AB1)]